MPQYYTVPQNGYYQVTTASTMTTQVWPLWVNQTSNATILPQNGWYQPTDQIWSQWVTTNQTSYSFQQVVETPEQRQERERVLVERRREQTAARARARMLLEGFLDDEQKVELEKKGRFHVTGSRGRRYCIRAEGQAGNVDLLKPDGSLQARLCCHPRQGLPDGDAWLMQMIEIRHDEEHFLRTANVHRGSLPVAA